MRNSIYRVFLWLAVIGWAAWFGGTLYQMSVIVPMWSASPPETVREFFLGTRYNETIWNFFGPPFMAARTLPVIGAIIFGWHLRRHRPWFVAIVLMQVFGILFTLFYIYPINEVLFFQAGGNHSPEEIRRMANAWVWSDRIRFGVGTIKLLCLLRVFSLPIKAE